MGVMTHRISILSVLVCGLFFSSFLSARAALEENKYTETQKVGFALVHFGGFKPDFDSWTRETDAYKESLPADKIILLQREAQRLQEGLLQYNPEEDLIRVMADAVVRRPDDLPPYPPKGEDGDVRSIPGTQTVNLRLGIGEGGEPFFGFQVGALWVALIPADAQTIGTITMPIAQYYAMVAENGYKDTGQTLVKTVIELKMKPLSVDTRGPVRVEDIEYWAMLADIASATLWNGRRDQAYWGYNAPWHQSLGRSLAGELYGE